LIFNDHVSTTVTIWLGTVAFWSLTGIGFSGEGDIAKESFHFKRWIDFSFAGPSRLHTGGFCASAGSFGSNATLKFRRQSAARIEANQHQHMGPLDTRRTPPRNAIVVLEEPRPSKTDRIPAGCNKAATSVVPLSRRAFRRLCGPYCQSQMPSFPSVVCLFARIAFPLWLRKTKIH
jgi:hypothetical protein